MGRAARPLEQAAILAPSYGREQCSSQLPGVSSLCSLLRSTPRLFSVSLFFVSWAYVRVYVGACECACVCGSRRRPTLSGVPFLFGDRVFHWPGTPQAG